MPDGRAGCCMSERILTENLLPFWTGPTIVDEEHGGFRLFHALNGTWLGPRHKTLAIQVGTPEQAGQSMT
jgi:hypothetical protein